jgi:hypothetical protein
MILSESDIRKIIRNAILNEGFLSGKVESLNSVKFGNKEYHAYGYANMQPWDPKTRNYKKEEVKVVVFDAPKSHMKTIMQAGGAIVGDDFKVTNLSGRNMGTFGAKSGDGKNKMMTFFLPTNSPNLSYSTEKLDLGLPSMADYTVEIGGILGAIPGIGNVADIGTGIIAAIKDPPDYLIAAFSILCAIPALGIGIAFAKEAVKSAGKQGAPGVAKVLQKELLDKRVTLDATMMSKIKKQYTSLLGSITAKGRVDTIAKLTNQEAGLIAARLGETKKYIDDIVDNLEVVGKSSKGVDNLSKVVVKRTSAKLLEEITTGQIGNVCSRWAKELAELLPKKYPNPPKGLIGRAFKHPATGKDVVFKSFGEFKAEFLKLSDLLDNEDGVDIFMKYYETIATAPIPVKPQNIEMITDMLMQKMTKIKIKMIVDPKIAAKEFGKGTKGIMRHGDPPVVLINYAKFSKDGLEKNIQETMEHELIHGIDKLLLTVLAGGDELAKDLIKRKGMVMASDLAGVSGVLKGAKGNQLSDYIFNEKSVKNIIDKGSRNLDGLTNWQYYLARVGKFSASDIAYVSDPAEMFVRVQRVSYWLKQNGFKHNEWDQFFRRDANEMISEIPDSDFFRPFFDLFKDVYNDNSPKFKKIVVEDLYVMFNALV